MLSIEYRVVTIKPNHKTLVIEFNINKVHISAYALKPSIKLLCIPPRDKLVTLDHSKPN